MKVGSEPITLAEYQTERARHSEGFSHGDAAVEQRARWLDELIGLKAALAKARAGGLDRVPTTRALIEKLIASQFIEAQFSNRTLTKLPASDDEVLAYYEKHSDQFHVPAAVRACVLCFKIGSKADTDRRAELRLRAEAVRTQALNTDAAGFVRLVQPDSKNQASSYTGGDTGWLEEGKSESSWPEAVRYLPLAAGWPGKFN